MEPFKPTPEELVFCMKDAKCIRNVCILAHVDHGKTTMADLLLSTNRLLSQKLAGFLRYLDDRPDEQERGITMKSSAVSLLNILKDEDTDQNKRLLLNLIDTPGHIDFSSEVGAALRVSDGAIILVDLVEGVCVQTREAIKQAFEANAKMLLVLNKFDRLITELNKDIDDVFQCILRAIEDCNAIVAELYQYETLDPDVDIEDTGLLFSPNSGNVIFASAIDGWALTTRQVARMFVGLVKNETVDSLNDKIWNFDCYVDSKKEIQTGAIDKKRTNLFVQFVLKTIIHIYDTIVVRMEKEQTESILAKLNITNVTRDMNHTDAKVQIRAILQAWKPLASTIFMQCIRIIPPPSTLDSNKTEYLLNRNKYREDAYLNKCVEDMLPHFADISVNNPTPCFAYVAKMFCVQKHSLSQNKPKIFVPGQRTAVNVCEKLDQLSLDGDQPPKKLAEEIVVVALARVFTGVLRTGQEMYVLSSSYLPNEMKIAENEDDFVANNKHVEKVVIKELYMLFGRELMLVDEVAPGNFCGIAGLEANVIRTATLSSTLNVVPFIERTTLEPIVRNSIEPVNPKDLPILRQGLKLLMQSDSCVQVVMQESGELMLLTAGDVHLAKCIEDLTHKFAPIELHVSSPMVALRETVVNDSFEFDAKVEDADYTLAVTVVTLPNEIIEVIRNNLELLRTVEGHQRKSLIDIIRQAGHKMNEPKEKVFKSEITKRAVARVKEQLKSSFTSCGSQWENLHEKIWSVSKLSDCVNVLINNTDNYCKNIFVEYDEFYGRTLFDHCIVNAFNAICKAGPLCEEPLLNCAFIVHKFELNKDVLPNEITPRTTYAIESDMRNTFKRAFEEQEQRLMEPMFITDIQVNTSILGKVYTVVNKRHGKVLDAVGMDEQEKTFLVKAQIPVMESVGFANEIRKTTSGQAIPNLRFSHYEIIDGDPFYEQEEDDDEDDENNINIVMGLRANKLRREVRRRKGLHVDDEVVIHAEKQRTLNKKK